MTTSCHKVLLVVLLHLSLVQHSQVTNVSLIRERFSLRAGKASPVWVSRHRLFFDWPLVLDVLVEAEDAGSRDVFRNTLVRLKVNDSAEGRLLERRVPV